MNSSNLRKAAHLMRATALSLVVTLLASLMPVLPATAFAATGAPRILNYQGRLMDSSGTLLGGTGTAYCFRFSLYDNPTVGSGTKLWPAGTPSDMTATVKNGVFSVGVGDTNAGGDLLDYDFQSSDSIYLNVEVANKTGGVCGSYENLSPRNRVDASGYAINANTVGGLSASQLIASGFATTSADFYADSSTTIAKTYTNNIFGGTQTFNSASTSNLVVSNGFTFGSVSGILKSVAGVVSAALVNLATDVTGVLPIANGGTGTSTAPTFGKLLVGNAAGGYDLVATSTLGLVTVENLSGYFDAYLGASSTVPKTFTANAFTALQSFGNASTTNLSASYASSTQLFAGLGSFGQATTSNLAITGIGNALLKANANGSVIPAVPGTDYLDSSTGVSSVGQTYGTAQNGAITFATSSATTFNGLSISNGITNAGGTFTFAPSSISGTLDNTGLTNSTISGVPLGSTLASLTAGNTSLSFSGAYNGGIARSITLNMTNINTWSAQQRFNGIIASASSTIISLSSTDSTTTNLHLTGTIDGGGLGACNGAGDKLTYNASTRQFECGIDAGATGSFSTTSSDYWLSQKSTSDLSEGSNLYFTTGRATTSFIGNLAATSSVNSITTLNNLSLPATQLSGFGVPFYQFLSATTTDALAQGSTNKYYSSALFSADLAATSSVGSIVTLNSLVLPVGQVSGFNAAVDTEANSYIAASTTIPKTYTSNTFTATQNFASTTASQATTTSLAITSVTGSLIKTNSLGQVAAALAGTDYVAPAALGSYLALTDWYGTTTDALEEGTNNLYFTTARGNANFASNLAATTTTALAEGSNLYFTTGRATTSFIGNLAATTSINSITTLNNLSLPASQLAGFGVPFYQFFAATTTDALAQGTINKYYATSLFAADLAGTTTDALAEGTNNLYFTTARVNSFVAASTTIPKTYADNTFSGTNAFTGNTTLGNATSTSFFATALSALAGVFGTVNATSSATSSIAGPLAVGITNSSYPVSVLGSATAATGATGTAVVAITNNDATLSSGNNVLRLNLRTPYGTACTTGTTCPRFMEFFTGLGAGNDTGGRGVGSLRLSTAGTGITQTSGSADFAEFMQLNSSASTGDLVSLNSSGQYQKAVAGQSLVGIISDNPAFVGNGNLEGTTNAYIVGFAGVVPATVSADNGAISAGDLIAAGATPGVGVKLVNSGYAVGQALQSFSGPGTGTINVLVLPKFVDASVALQSYGGSQGGDSGYWSLATSTGAVTLASSTYALVVNNTATIANASTTNISATYASSTQGFFGSLSVGNLSGVLRASGGALSTGLVGLASEVSGVLGVANGGTGTSTTPTYGKLLVGNAAGGYDLVATSSLGIIGGGVSWGSITGTLSNQTDLQNALNAKLDLSAWYSTTTDQLKEGTNNLYFTPARATSNFVSNLAGTSSVNSITTLNNLSITNSQISDFNAGINSYISSSTTIPKTYTSNTFANVNTFNGQTNLSYASSTGISSSYASSTQGFFGSLSVGALSGVVRASAGALTTGAVNLASEASGILGIANGGTGWANIQSGTLLTGNGAGALATTSIGSSLQLSGGSLSLNLGNANVWSGLQTFGNSSTTIVSAYRAYFGGTATTSIDGAGNVVVGGSLTSNSAAGTYLASTSATRLTVGAATSTNATSTTLFISSALTGAGLSACSNGPTDKLLWNAATGQFSCGSDASGVTSIGAAGQGQTGATQTFATSTDANIGLTITSSANTHTFTTIWNGILSAARGGTGWGNLQAGTLLTGNGTGAVATTSIGSSLQISGGTLSLNLSSANTWSGLQVFNQASSTLLETVTEWARTIQSTSTNALVIKTSLTATAGLTLGSTSTPQMFALDTQNNRATIGTGGASPTLFLVDSKNTTGDPTGVNGATYYNSNDGLWRCYASGWRTCGGQAASSTGDVQVKGSDGGFTAESNFHWDLVNNTLSLTGTAGQSTDLFIVASSTGTSMFSVSSAGVLELATTTDPSSPPSGQLDIYAKDIAGRLLPKWVGPAGVDTPIQPNLGFNRVAVLMPAGGTTCSTAVGGFGTTFVTNAGTCANPAPASGNLKNSTVRTTFSSGTTAGTVAYSRPGRLQVWRGNTAGLGGFFFTIRFGLNTTQSGNRAFVGLTDTAGNPTNVDPTTSTTPGKVGLAINANTGNWKLVNNITGTAPTVTDLGASFPVNTTDLLELILYSAPNDTVINYRVTDLSTGAQTTGNLSANIPSNTTFLAPLFWITNNATAAAAIMDFGGWYIESDN